MRLGKIVPAVVAALAVACGGGAKDGATTPVPPPPPAVAAKQDAPVFPDEPWRTARPRPGEPRPMQLPEIQSFKLKNGIDVYLVERHELPTLSLDLVLDGGSIDEPQDKAGMVGLCMALLDDGTEKLEKIPFEEALADMASSVATWTEQDQKGVSANTLTKFADQTLDLWADTITRPGLRQVDFDRNVKQRKTSIQQARRSPGAAAARVNDSIVYGPQHAYTRISTEKTLDAIKLDDCKKFVKAYLKPQGAKLFIVGDIDRKRVEDEIGARLASWTGRAKAPAKVGAAKPREGRIFFVDTPGASQAQVRIMHLGPQRKAPDYFATRLLSAILGDGFASRINMNIREGKGWAYGARGGFRYTRDLGTFTAAAGIRADATKGSAEEIMKEIKGVMEADPTPDELEREKNGLVLSLPGEFASGEQALDQYRALVYYGLPLDYHKGFIENVTKVTPGEIRAAAQVHLNPAQAKLLVVGDGATVLPQLQELQKSGLFGDGPIVKLDADGNVVQ